MAQDWQTRLWTATAPAGGISVNVPSRAALLEDLSVRLRRGDGFAVATLNLDHVVKLRRDPDFVAAYVAQTHVTADGNPIVWVLRLAGHPVELTPGSELVEPIAMLAARHKVPVGLFGSDQPSLEAAAAALQARCPGLEVAACIAPPMGFDPHSAAADALCAQLHASGARVVFLALGAPKQELLATRLHAQFPEMGMVSIGAGLDFLSGRQTRAPWLARKLAMEWAWRLMANPGRLWRRYRDCFIVLPGLAGTALRLRRQQDR
jgi:exopolysaccharide biosynthesis WecB/TagA/CpsF family protein